MFAVGHNVAILLYQLRHNEAYSWTPVLQRNSARLQCLFDVLQGESNENKLKGAVTAAFTFCISGRLHFPISAWIQKFISVMLLLSPSTPGPPLSQWRVGVQDPQRRSPWPVATGSDS